MNAVNHNCPGCGASLEIESRFARSVVCGFCNQLSHLVPGGISAAGTGVVLADAPSIFSVGQTGRFREMEFTTMGRLRIQYQDGFWDEWYLGGTNDQQFWLQEDEGEFTLYQKHQLTSTVPGFDAIRVGATIAVNSLSVFVVERGEAIVSGGQGQIPFPIYPGAGFYYVDGNAGGKLVSLEFEPDEIGFFMGQAVSFSDFDLDRES